MTGPNSIQQFARVMAYVTDADFQSIDEANPFDRQEYREWFDQTHEEETEQ